MEYSDFPDIISCYVRKVGSTGMPYFEQTKDMLLLTSEVAGEQFVKALDVDTLGIHNKMGKGNEIIREDGAVLVKAVKVLDDDGSRIALKGSGIFIEKNQKYTKGGVKFSALAPAYKKMIGNLSGTPVCEVKQVS